MFLTIQDLDTKLYPEITAMLSRYGEVIVLAHLGTAQGEIETYLGALYDIQPEMQKSGPARHKLLLPMAIDMAIYHMYSLAETTPAHRVKRYEQAIKMLELMSQSKLVLPGVPPAPEPETPTQTSLIGYGGTPQRPTFY